MRQDFRPTQVQLDYLNTDMIPFLVELGCDVNNIEYYIRYIDWYDWDDKPRWFVNIGIFKIPDGRQGYIEVDMKCEAYNGSDYPIAIESIEYAGHGFPCISTRIAHLDKESEQYIISKND
jgi:hypothetical protein